MNDTLNQLYNRFYTPLPMAECEQEIEDCHRQLIERLEKAERKLVLQIIPRISSLRNAPWTVFSVGLNWRGNWHTN